MLEGEYYLYNQVIVRAEDLTDKVIIINDIHVDADAELTEADLTYNVSIGVSYDSLSKIVLWLNGETAELTDEEYLKLDEDVVLHLSEFFTLEDNVQYVLIVEFHSANGNVVIRRFKFDLNKKEILTLKGKPSDIMKRKSNKSYTALDTDSLEGLEF